mgnify:CR=1 FL=1
MKIPVQNVEEKFYARTSFPEIDDRYDHPTYFDGPFGLAGEHERILFHDDDKSHALWLELSKFMEY